MDEGFFYRVSADLAPEPDNLGTATGRTTVLDSVYRP